MPLQKLLSRESMLVVCCNHIPYFEFSDSDPLLLQQSLPQERPRSRWASTEKGEMGEMEQGRTERGTVRRKSLLEAEGPRFGIPITFTAEKLY